MEIHTKCMQCAGQPLVWELGLGKIRQKHSVSRALIDPRGVPPSPVCPPRRAGGVRGVPELRVEVGRVRAGFWWCCLFALLIVSFFCPV